MNKFFILHGHFYQPPREDPWWQAVSRQNSAYPFHDWNERIYWECYLPNATSRVFDNDGRIVDIINNYSYINFNFGPTLLLWLQSQHPEFLDFIKSADKFSQTRNDGHGNAIAQAYNHMILPLANDQDKNTQIYWGKRFFESAFEREPEGMWLPEAACNYRTLKYLVRHRIKYIILSPYQVEKVRRIGEKKWDDVSDGSIDTQRSYRIFLDVERRKYIDCFFYNGPLSHAISFQQIMHSAQSFAERIIASFAGGDNPLISIATDGETFGHHHPFSEMCLGYSLKYELPSRGILCTNFGNYLEKFPPEYEVEIKRGDNDLGTSWSCSHGVKRWYDDCGCRIGVYPEWNQKWRKPLRDSLDWLRSQLDALFLKKGSSIFKDPWQARDNFIEVIIDSSEENVKKFYHRYAQSDESRLVEALKLLEMEHMGMLFYTSCAWFFDELSGIETVQNLRYAARAIQLAREISGEDLEREFLTKLSLARSNIARFGDGRGIYEQLVKPYVAEWDDYLSSFLIYSNFFPEEKKFYKFKIEDRDEHKIVKGDKEVDIGKIKMLDNVVKESQERIYLLKKQGGEELECYLSEFNESRFNELKKLFEGEVWISDKEKLAEVISNFFPGDFYKLKDIHTEERAKVIGFLFGHKKESIFEALNRIWEFNLPLVEEYKNVGLMLPYEMYLLGASILNYKIKEAFQNFRRDKNFQWLDEVKVFIREAKQMRLELELGEVKELVRNIAEELTYEVLKEPFSDKVAILLRFHREMLNLNIDYYHYLVQNIIAGLISNVELTPELEELARVYNFDSHKFLEMKRDVSHAGNT